MTLTDIIKGRRLYTTIVLASATFGCSSCGNDNLSKVPCIEYEICGNRTNSGKAKDDNCNGLADEGCDLDGDGFCGINHLSYQNDIEPTICVETFRNCIENPDLCTDREYSCKKSSDFFAGKECQNFEYDCNDYDKAISPNMEEICNGKDDDCNRSIDEIYPEKDKWCDYEGKIVNDYTSLPGICELGKPKCENGILECKDFRGPRDKEYCNNGRDDDCDPETRETPLVDARKCYTGPPETEGIGSCMGGVELCINGIIGGDGECHGEITPQKEICDCLDNNCNHQIDEGLTVNQIINGTYYLDNSGSMQRYQDKLRELENTQNPLYCSSNDQVLFSLVAIGDPNNIHLSIPLLRLSLVRVEDFANNISGNISANGPAKEPNGNAIVYAACDLLERSFVYDPTCEMLEPYNTLRPSHPDNTLGRPVYEVGAKLTAVIYSDEGYWWQYPAGSNIPPEYDQSEWQYINQQTASLLANMAGIKTIVYTLPGNKGLNLGGFRVMAGWGHFAINGGEVRDIGQINEPENLEGFIRDSLCINEK